MLQKFKHNEMWCLPMQPWGRVVVDSFILCSGLAGGGGMGACPPPPRFVFVSYLKTYPSRNCSFSCINVPLPCTEILKCRVWDRDRECKESDWEEK